ncbi:MAG: sugar ABC transporter ATP-binding protein [Gemmatimonadetes bacterium]|nr:sugar ABC transporter ATP-binding protein [Gemmatimonadota bacterium]MYH18287.1 sugar ABC transporter ATP-binding protein [Gemmatimonadota bacterium]MYK98225.1 sugar ABC transporter ATP-binding protein [Gemmatimonadota bacterium]
MDRNRPNSYIEFDRITKRFPGVTALDEVTFGIQAGTCHAVVGENGAGKSTLGRILTGIYGLDGGQIRIDGRPVQFLEPGDALELGIGMVHQELVFCENLSVAENLCLGNLPARGGFVSDRKMAHRARRLLSAIEVDMDVETPIGELPVAQQQLVQIAAALGSGARVIVFDEPTSSLSHVEAERLRENIRHLKSKGVTSIYISHDLDEIFRLCDVVTVLRDGRHVATRPVAELDRPALINLMIGRTFEAYFPSHVDTEPGGQMLAVENLSSPGKFEDVSFSVRSGEILALAGLVGAGRTEVLQAVFGLDPMATGRISVSGQPTKIRHPIDAMRSGIGLVPEDRKRFGLVLSLRVDQNIGLPTLASRSDFGWIRGSREEELAREYVRRLSVRPDNVRYDTAGLSGGNQQKVVLAKWLAANCPILLIDEPTRGVDVGAKSEMHALIDQLAHEGTAIVLVSSELPEVLNLSTRILVLRSGRVAGELSRGDADQGAVMRMMAGV